MSKKQKRPAFDLFYAEIPVGELTTSEYPNDIEITHAYDKPRSPSLSQDQLSQLAKELLREARRNNPPAKASGEQQK